MKNKKLYKVHLSDFKICIYLMFDRGLSPAQALKEVTEHRQVKGNFKTNLNLLKRYLDRLGIDYSQNLNNNDNPYISC